MRRDKFVDSGQINVIVMRAEECSFPGKIVSAPFQLTHIRNCTLECGWITGAKSTDSNE